MKIIRISFTLLLCGWVCYQAGIFQASGREKLLTLFMGADVAWVVFSVSFIFVLDSLSSIKWKMLLDACSDKVELWRLYVYYCIAQFFNLILPTSMGGDVVRIFLLGGYTGKRSDAAASVIVERFTGMVGMLIFAVFSMLLNFDKFNQKWLVIALVCCSLAAILLAWFVVKKKEFTILSFLPLRKYNFLESISRKIIQVRNAIFEYSDNRKALVVALLNSFLFQIGAVLNVWVTARVFSDEISLMLCMTTVPIILFIMNIPFSIGGIGLMEFAYLFVFSLFGVSPSLAISVAMLLRLKSILDALIGGGFYLLIRDGLKVKISDISNKGERAV